MNEGIEMSKVVIEISELRNKYNKKVKKLAIFLEGKLRVKTDIAGDEIAINYGEKLPSKDYLRVLLRKFLHKEKLKEQFRVISGKDHAFIVKEKRTREYPS